MNRSRIHECSAGVEEAVTIRDSCIRASFEDGRRPTACRGDLFVDQLLETGVVVQVGGKRRFAPAAPPPEVEMTLELVHHAANRGHNYPPGSLSALRYCLEAGARIVEVDITPLAADDFALFHDSRWEKATDGQGPVAATTVAQATRLHYVGDGFADEPVGLLSQAVALLRDHPRTVELQLDLKAHSRLDDEVLHRLLRLIAPVRERIRVTSPADWALRRLRAMDAELALGFDPLLYLALPTDKEPTTPPFRAGAYGYRDDHPLSVRRWGTTAEYLAARAGILAHQAPKSAAWYIHAPLLARALDDGFNWIDYLHRQGARVDAWTLDADHAGHVALARRLIEAGVDLITTNNVPALAAAITEWRLSLSGNHFTRKA